jgi:hypothetical protein
MVENDHEHKAFETYCKSQGLNTDLDLERHPLHLLYLDEKTREALAIFQAGYFAGRFKHRSENV